MIEKRNRLQVCKEIYVYLCEKDFQIESVNEIGKAVNCDWIVAKECYIFLLEIGALPQGKSEE